MTEMKFSGSSSLWRPMVSADVWKLSLNGAVDLDASVSLCDIFFFWGSVCSNNKSFQVIIIGP